MLDHGRTRKFVKTHRRFSGKADTRFGSARTLMLLRPCARLGVFLAALSLIGLALAGSVTAFNYVVDINGTFWGIQDDASPHVDTGSIRGTQVAAGRRGAFSTLINGYAGIKVMVHTTPAPRFNGEMMRGFGLLFDGVERFQSTRSVDMGGVKRSDLPFGVDQPEFELGALARHVH